jgi:acetoin utilization protein AcuB
MMFVRDYMTPNPITVEPDISYPEAMGILRRKKVRRLPVVEQGRLVGIVVEEDLLSNQPSPATTLSIHEMYALLERLRVRQIMSRPVITVEGVCPVEEAARVMVENKIGCLPVMDGEKLVGIITETDIFKTLVEVLGGQEIGMRLTLRLPDRVGELAKVTAQIAQAGGNIIAVTTSRLLEDAQREVTVKESGADQEALMALLNAGEAVILDVRPSSKYQPRLFS